MANMNLFKTYIYLFIIVSFCIKAEWINWGRNQCCNPALVLSPQSKEELVSGIAQAVKDNRKINIVGAGHSFSGIVGTHDCLLDMRKLNNIVSIDHEKMQVCAQGGILLNELNEQIAKYDLSLANFPAMGNMTLAGAMATATHGTGYTGTLSSFIREIELIGSDGKTYIFSVKQDPEAFKAACVSLGALGVMYTITVQCEPLFMLEYSKKEMSLGELLVHYHELNHRSDYFQFRWQLSDDLVTADFWNKTVSHNPSIDQKVSYDALQWDPNPEAGMAAEIAVPVDLLPQAIELIKILVSEWIQRGLVITEVVGRFVKADGNNFLSPTSDRDVVYLNIGTDFEDRYYDFFKNFEEVLLGLSGRPHWGKVNFLTYQKAYRLYGESLTKFIEIKKRIDPMNTFSNQFLDSILAHC